MTAADEYVKSVLEWMPRTMSRRVQIGTELQGHIAERVAAGYPIAEVLRQLGDPVALAESYLAEVPLIPAPHGRRIGAKLADLVMCIAMLVMTIVLIMLPAWWFGLWHPEVMPFLLMWAVISSLIVGSILFGIYTVVAEWRSGQTLGKRLFGLRVVTESGAQYRARPVDRSAAPGGPAGLPDRRDVRLVHGPAPARVRDAVEDTGAGRG